jgi:uncharacterized membrane protein
MRHAVMTKNRLEAFSDGVIAIIITIMVLEMPIPHDASWGALGQVWPTFLAYIMSFVYVGIYWNNHHHMMHLAPEVNGRILWANLCLLFWLSLFPWSSGWLGENHFAPAPASIYGVVLLMAALSFLWLEKSIVAHQGEESPLRKAVGKGYKEKISCVLYAAGIGLALLHESIAMGIYIAVALVWLIPDRRIEKLA